jgi:predicted Kef-type K+ transport protein
MGPIGCGCRRWSDILWPASLMGPITPGFVADAGLAGQLAEMGVILLMFGVGLHFSAADLLAVRGVAVPGAIVQILIATLLGIGLAEWWGWSLGAGIVFGLSLSVASTVVLLKALEERNLVDSASGRVAVGWLIVEDLAMVLALVLLPAFAELLGGNGRRYSPWCRSAAAADDCTHAAEGRRLCRHGDLPRAEGRALASDPRRKDRLA